MKKTFFTLLSCFMLFSCGEDDSNNSTSDDTTSEEENAFVEDIIGTWELQSLISDGVEYVEVYMEETDTYVCKNIEKYDGEFRQYTEVWGFDQNCDQQSVGDNDEAYTIDGNILTINVPDENPDDEYDDSYTEVYIINQLDDTTMILEYTEDDETDISTFTRIE